MSISFECQGCDADYDLEIPKLVEHPETLKCPNCGSHPPKHRSHALATAIEDLLAATAAVRQRVRFELNVDSHDLPSPYGRLTGQEGGLSFDEDEPRHAERGGKDDEAPEKEPAEPAEEDEDDDDLGRAGFHEEDDDDFGDEDLGDLGDDDDDEDDDTDDDDDLDDDLDDLADDP